MKEETLISPKEAAVILGYKSYASVKKLWENGSIKVKFVNNRPKIVRSSLQNFINHE